MPSFRKLNPADLGAQKQRPLSERARVAQEYDTCLDGFAIGDYGRVELAAGDRRAVVRRRLQAAARRRGLTLRFRPGPGAALIFRADEAPAAAPKPARAPKATPQPSATPAPRASERAAVPATPEPRRPRGTRQPAASRYDKVLPRWMRDGAVTAPRRRRDSEPRRTK